MKPQEFAMMLKLHSSQNPNGSKPHLQNAVIYIFFKFGQRPYVVNPKYDKFELLLKLNIMVLIFWRHVKLLTEG